MKYQGVSIERAQRIIARNNELELMQFSGELKRIYDKRIKNNNKEQNIEN